MDMLRPIVDVEEVPLDPLLQNTLIGLSSFEYIKRDGRLWASQSGLCERQTALSSRFEGTTEIKPSSRFYFDIGKEFERVLVNSWNNQEILLSPNDETQVVLPDIGINLGGKIDAVVLLKNNVYIVEVKTCGTLPPKPKKAHDAQAQIYSGILGLPVYVYYIERNISDFSGELHQAAFLSEYDKSYDYLYRAVYGHFASMHNVVPPIPKHMLKSYCGFCDFIDYCWNDGNIPYAHNFEKPSAKDLNKIDKDTRSFLKDFYKPANIKKRRLEFLDNLMILRKDVELKIRLSNDYYDKLY